MPLTLTTPLVHYIDAHSIKSILIDMDNNVCKVGLSDIDSENVVIANRELSFGISDDFNNIIIPNDWPLENPDGSAMYSLIQHYCFMRLQDTLQLEAGTIS